MKAALKAADKPRLSALRLILSEIKQREVDTREELTDVAILVILEKMTKQRRDSLKQFISAGRQDLAAIEQFELDVITDYQPDALTQTEIQDMIDATIRDEAASGMKDMGKVMASLRSKIQGRADMSLVSSAIKVRLSS